MSDDKIIQAEIKAAQTQYVPKRALDRQYEYGLEHAAKIARGDQHE